MNKINVVFGLDDKYILQAFVVMYSILKNSNAFFAFFLLTSDDIMADFAELQKILVQEYNNFSARIVIVEEDFFETSKINCPHLSKAAFNRLLIAELVNDEDKCIYLDCDLIVNGDLALLYEYDLKDNYIAGVKDCHLIGSSNYEEAHRIQLGLPSCKKYVNSGVLLMNLKKIREDHLTKRFIERAQIDNQFEDQDVLNFCCYGHIGILPLKWNVFHFYFGNDMNFINNTAFEENELIFDWYKPNILHMGAEYKPWNSKRFKGSDQWWEYAHIYETNRWHYFYENKSNNIIKTDLDYFLNQLIDNQNKKVIWGYTPNAKQLYDILINEKVQNIVYFVDNNTENEGKRYKGISVLSGEKVLDKIIDLKNVEWIISCQNNEAYLSVKTQIMAMGVSDSHIFRSDYNVKSYLYYLALKEEFYDNELNEVLRCELLVPVSDCKQSSKYIAKNIKMKDVQNVQEKYKMKYWILKNYGT